MADVDAVCAKCGASMDEEVVKGRIWLLCKPCCEMIEKLMKESKADG